MEAPLDVDVSGSKELEIPALSTFKILEATVVQQPEQFVSVRFSDPLLKTQDLDGLIEIDNTKNLRLEIDGNVVKVWPGKRVSGTRTMNVYQGIKSANYARLKER